MNDRGHLPSGECLAIALSLSRALANLHGHGLAHRDVKPSNVIFVNGQAKLADIGLVTSVDATRSFVGTEGYLPPEGAGTPQADIFSLGKVLYEMSTGCDRKEFPALPPDIATRSDRDALAELNAVIVRACQLDPRERYKCAEEMHRELALLERGQSVRGERTQRRRWGLLRNYGFATVAVAILMTGVRLVSDRFHVVRSQRSESPAIVAAGVKSIAVLPFDNESPDKADEYLGQSVADELSGVLTKIPELRVLGRDSAAALKSAKDRRAAAQQLKVGAVLVGRIRKSANQLRLAAQLINTADDSLRWSEVYDRPLPEIFGIQTDIAEQVAEKLHCNLTDTGRERLAAKPTRNFAAYQFYREGRDHLTRRGVGKAIEDFRSAIRLDPDFVLAYAGLADAYGDAASNDYVGIPTEECISNALSLAEQAVGLDRRSAEAHTSLAKAKFLHYDWEGAEQEFQWAIRLNPNLVQAHGKYAQLLSIKGRFNEAIAAREVAKALDPFSPEAGMGLGWILFDARRYPQAEREFRRILELDENFVDALKALGWCHEAEGRHNEAVALWEKADGLSGVSPETITAFTRAYKSAGMRGYWQKRLEQRTDPSPYWIAADYAVLGENDEAFKWLAEGYAQHSGWMPLVATEYRFYNLHSDPRFAELLKKLRLEMPVWKK